ncbi:TetR family transcriptional regulator [Bradyrhizobium forestalis]|uniref:TetR family transcriptional regulator n=1 Tax=Bradyrhizobium forestalis TaxID=1419263 RepID=A0A2M8R0B6_9BRAD|nr:TetR/AcrR family transcriptional regulator [Bradyrhizobium forestalis]PJG51240.1 TetR family transcriptional regulator [Bradyrhizobium forestalis]
MNRPVRRGLDSDEARARILGAAEEHFRRVGYHRTSVADIAADLGMSPANIYRFFPSRDAINESICGRLMNEFADVALAIARTDAPATDKLGQLLTAVHAQSKVMLAEARPMHDLIVVAMQENWPIIRAHVERMVMILEAVIREGADAGEFDVDDAAEAARAVRSAFVPFFHPILLEHCVAHGEDTQAGLRGQIRFILKALGKCG